MKHKIFVHKGVPLPMLPNGLWYVRCYGCAGGIMEPDPETARFGTATREEAHAIGVKHQTRHTNVPGVQCAACEVIGDKLTTWPVRDERGRFRRSPTKTHVCGPAC